LFAILSPAVDSYTYKLDGVSILFSPFLFADMVCDVLKTYESSLSYYFANFSIRLFDKLLLAFALNGLGALGFV